MHICRFRCERFHQRPYPSGGRRPGKRAVRRVARLRRRGRSIPGRIVVVARIGRSINGRLGRETERLGTEISESEGHVLEAAIAALPTHTLFFRAFPSADRLSEYGALAHTICLRALHTIQHHYHVIGLHSIKLPILTVSIYSLTSNYQVYISLLQPRQTLFHSFDM